MQDHRREAMEKEFDLTGLKKSVITTLRKAYRMTQTTLTVEVAFKHMNRTRAI